MDSPMYCQPCSPSGASPHFNIIDDGEVECGSLSDDNDSVKEDIPSTYESVDEAKTRLREEIRLLNCCKTHKNCLLLKSSLEDAVEIVYE